MKLALALAALLVTTEARAQCRGRPTDAAFTAGARYGDVEVKSHATGRVRVHWATSGTHAPRLTSSRPDAVPDTVAFAADVAQAALDGYAGMGFRPVPPDTACASNGGDDRVDVYLVKFAGADGAAVAECAGPTCSSFALVDATFAGKGYASVEEGLRTVVTHELFHAVQNTYRRDVAPFWAEGTAQWAMKTLHPDLQDFERLLPAFFREPTRSIDAPPGGVTAGFLYGSAVWPLFLAQRFGPETIRETFELQATNEAPDPLAAVDQVLARRGSSLALAYPEFAAWNAGTGVVASAGGYPDAARYPGIAVGVLEDGVGAITSGLSYHAFRGAIDAGRIALETDAARNAGVLVPIEAGILRLDRATPLPAPIAGEALVVVAGVTSRKTDAPFTIRVLPPETVAPPAESGCSQAPSPKLPSIGGAAGAALVLAALRRRRAA